MCKAVLSNQNALRYHLKYVHGINRDATTSNSLIQKHSITAATSVSVPSLSASSLLSNNKKHVETPIQITLRTVKNENQEN